MKPTLRQLKKLSILLVDLHALGVTFSDIKLLQDQKKPLIVLNTEPVSKSNEPIQYFIDWDGKLVFQNQKQNFLDMLSKQASAN